MDIRFLSQFPSQDPSTDPVDPLLQQIGEDMGYDLLQTLIDSLAFATPEDLAQSLLISQIEGFIPIVVKDLEDLQYGTAKDKQAYDSPSTQAILNFLTKPQFPGGDSLYTASLNKDNNDVASILFAMKVGGTLNTKNGLIGQIRLFVAEWCPSVSDQETEMELSQRGVGQYGGIMDLESPIEPKRKPLADGVPHAGSDGAEIGVARLVDD
jgi:hypothetical protein